MRPKPFCKFLLENRCTKGKHCQYRHHGPGKPTNVSDFLADRLTVLERPPGTAYSCELLQQLDIAGHEEYLVRNAPADSYTQILDNGIIVTFTADLEPTNIEFLPKIEVKQVTAALEVTLYRPSRNCWLECSSQSHAQQVFRALDGVRISGITLRCTSRPCAEDKWTVQVTNATESVNDERLLALLPPHVIKPENVRSGTLQYDTSVDDIKVLKEKIATVTARPVTGTEILEIRNKLRRTMLFTFEGAPNLTMLARSLDGQRLLEFGNTAIFVAERLQVTLSVDRKCFEKHSGQLKGIASQLRRSSQAHIHYENSADRVTVIIRSKSRKEAMRASAMIDRVFVDSMASVFHHLQPRPRATLPSHRLRLTNTSAYRSVLKGGLAEARNTFGENCVKLDDESDPPAVVVNGDTTMLRQVQAILFPGGRRRGDSRPIVCAICWDPTEGYAKVPGCGHTCCTTCFVAYCTTPRDTVPALQCFGPDCTEPIPVPTIREQLAESDMNTIMTQALQAHFERHPSEYTQCPGPDCVQYHRISDCDGHYECEKCFTVVCTSCRVEKHFGETCRQYQDRMTGNLEAMERWMEAAEAKRCRRCQAVVQKMEGCNNMQCTSMSRSLRHVRDTC